MEFLKLKTKGASNGKLQVRDFMKNAIMWLLVFCTLGHPAVDIIQSLLCEMWKLGLCSRSKKYPAVSNQLELKCTSSLRCKLF